MNLHKLILTNFIHFLLVFKGKIFITPVAPGRGVDGVAGIA